MDGWTLRTLILMNLAMAGVDGGVLWHLRGHRTAAAWWKAAIGGAGGSVALVAIFGIAPGVLPRAPSHPVNIFFLMHLASWVLFVHAPVCLLGGAILLRKTARKTAVLSLLGALGVLGVGVDAFWIEPTGLVVTRVTIKSSKLDQPLRLALVADIQTDQIGPYERRALERLREEDPDVILFAGDYLHAPPGECVRTREALNALMKAVGLETRHGAFAIEGNVDYRLPWTTIFKDLPVLPLRTTHTLSAGPIRLTCLSVRDSFNPRLEIEQEDHDRFHVVLGHCPNFAMGRIDADLLLAGHTHGGQVRLPFFGPLTTGCDVPREWSSGLTELTGGAKLYVSRGVGMERGAAPRVRFLCRPELVIIDLVPE